MKHEGNDSKWNRKAVCLSSKLLITAQLSAEPPGGVRVMEVPRSPGSSSGGPQPRHPPPSTLSCPGGGAPSTLLPAQQPGVVGLGAGGAGGQRSAPSMPPACSSVRLSWFTQMAVSASGHLTVMDFRQVINFHEVAFIVLARMASSPAMSLYWDSAGSDYFQIVVFFVVNALFPRQPAGVLLFK